MQKAPSGSVFRKHGERRAFELSLTADIEQMTFFQAIKVGATRNTQYAYQYLERACRPGTLANLIGFLEGK